MNKLLVSGDWHGEFLAAQASAREAVRRDCDAIVQCGDFGYWPHTDADYLTQVNSAMKKASKKLGRDLNVYWVDGNHENFDALFGGNWEVTPEGFWKMADHVFYVPRGTRWEWNGTKFLALGGGYSMDKQWRLGQGPIGQYWWPQETITQRNVYECINGLDGVGYEVGEVDVMFTHDMPAGNDLGMRLLKNFPEDEQNRMAVRTVVDAVKPTHLFHGHYHHPNDSVLPIDGHNVKIHSLDMFHGGRDEHNIRMWKTLELEDGPYAWHDPEVACPRCGEWGVHTCSLDAPVL